MSCAVVAGACYLLVLPAVRDEDVVLHLHGEVQPREGVTQPHPERRGIAGHRCHGSHFLLPPVPLLHPTEGQKEGSAKLGCEITAGERKEGKGGVKDFLKQWPSLRMQGMFT